MRVGSGVRSPLPIVDYVETAGAMANFVVVDESEGAFVTTASIAGIKPGGSSVVSSFRSLPTTLFY